jgi:hypothetical protein
MVDTLLQFGVERTGSTLVTQILWDINKEFYRGKVNVVKAHDFKRQLCGEGTRILCTYRDFRDVLISLWRVHKKKKNSDIHPIDLSKLDRSKYENKECGVVGVKITKEEIGSYGGYLLNGIRAMSLYKESVGSRDSFLRYEDFVKNYSIIFDEIEYQLGIKIDSGIRSRISNKRSFESNKKIAAKMKNFGEYDVNSYIHGDHLHKGSVGGWVDYVRSDMVGYLNNLLKEPLLKWGYSVKELPNAI